MDEAAAGEAALGSPSLPSKERRASLSRADLLRLIQDSAEESLEAAAPVAAPAAAPAHMTTVQLRMELMTAGIDYEAADSKEQLAIKLAAGLLAAQNSGVVNK